MARTDRTHDTRDERGSTRAEEQEGRRKRHQDDHVRRSSHHHRRERRRSRSTSIEDSHPSKGSAPSERKESSRKYREREREPRSPQNRSSPRSGRRERHSPRRRSRSPKRERESRSRSKSPVGRSRKPLPSQEESYRGQNTTQQDSVDKPVEKQKPNFERTGLLAAETNKVNIGSSSKQKSIVLKYHEPPEARKPPSSDKWILYVFKGASQEPLDTIALHTRSCWLLGRESAVADIPTEHPSCSKQHAVFQFRHTVKKDEWGEKKNAVGLYILDLESANGTHLNGEQIGPARYVQCMDGDVVKLGDSSREYVILLPKD